MESEVERTIREMMEARAEYERNKFKSEAKKTFLSGTPAKILGYLTEQKSELDLLSPKRARDNPELKAKIDKVSADPSVPESAMRAKAVQLVDGLRGKIVARADDLKTAFEETKTELRRQADPFAGSADIDNALSRYMSEIQLAGGFPKDKVKLAKRVETELAGYDPGAQAFWSRNFKSTFDNADIGNLSLDRAAELGEKIEGKIKDLLSKKRDDSQRLALQRLAELESSWQRADLSKQYLVVNSYLRDEPAENIAAPTPRAKTELERRQAEAHAANKRAVALAEEAKEFARNLQARVDAKTAEQLKGKQR